MAITVNLAPLEATLYKTILLLGYQNPDVITPDVVETAPFTLEEIREALFMSDLEIATFIVGLLDHPFRNNFFTETPIVLTSGQRIPIAIAPHSKVMINNGTQYVKGRLAENYEHFRNTMLHANIFGPGENLYWIEDGCLEFIGTGAQIFSPTVNLDRATAISTDKLINPENYANAIIQNSFKMLYMKGQDLSQREFYTRQSQLTLARIAGKELSIPEPEVYRRLNT